MTPHEKRAIETVRKFLAYSGPADEWQSRLASLCEKLSKDAHAAGFEAGLKARLPSREECVDFAKHLDSDGYFGALDCYDWLAANMRKGDGDGI